MDEKKENKKIGKKIICLILGVIILLALPFLIFRPVADKEVSAKNQKRFTFMTNTPRAENDQHDLNYWEKTGNPQLFAKPDSKFGYSAFLNPEMKHLKPALTGIDNLPALPGFFAPGMIELQGARSPEELLMQARFPLIEISQKYNYLFVKKPAFILEGGVILPIADFQVPVSKAERLTETILKVEKKSKTEPPVITVVQSCGDEQLDKAAMRALLFPAAVKDHVKGIVRIEWQQSKDVK